MVRSSLVSPPEANTTPHPASSSDPVAVATDLPDPILPAQALTTRSQVTFPTADAFPIWSPFLHTSLLLVKRSFRVFARR